MGMPDTRSMQIIRGPQYSQYTSGAVIILLSPKAWMFSRKRLWRHASTAGFSSWNVTAWRSRIMFIAPDLAPHLVRSQPCEPEHDPQVGGHRLTDPRALKLHHSGSPIGERARVDLNERCRRRIGRALCRDRVYEYVKL